ncbi:hypothetical protein H0H92_009948 [Tricholoma furcatifolium]|nr:hypothetical protein H0H92_009948 [Tricholoma furcatifolium]
MANYHTSSQSSGPSSEAGLAEWTDKIKAMQRQLDADEEAEQIRLEQEIAASRLARKRRSQGFVPGNPSDLDMSRSGDEELNNTTSPRISADSEITQPPRSAPYPSANAKIAKRSTTAKVAAEPISLAAFMGGSASGPRLRKHAPQQDAHDPTQFQQPDFRRSPHPTFGAGGIAMPGLVVQKDGPMKPSAIAAMSKSRTTESPSPQVGSHESQAPNPDARNTSTRQRTGSSSSPLSSSPTKQTLPLSYNPNKSQDSPQPPVSKHNRATPERSTVSPTSSSADRFQAPSLTHSLSSPSPSKSVHIPPALAGPIRPEPRPSVSGPQIPVSITPSKAFTRVPVQKELTPSLSRLQGRGFVQNMVKVSSQFESPPAIPETPERPRPASDKRQSSVLDRWQPNVSTTPSPTPSAAPRLSRRSVTFDLPKDEKAQLSQPDLDRKPLKGAMSHPSLKQENIPPKSTVLLKPTTGDRVPLPVLSGPGSATTMVVYKPTPTETPAIDEFGAKPTHASRASAMDFLAPSKPLSHPTKDRARKPRKKGGSGLSEEPMSVLNVQTIKESTPSSDLDPVPPPMNVKVGDRPSSEPNRAPLRPAEVPMGNALQDPMGSRHVVERTARSVLHSNDVPRLVRHALPGLASSQIQTKSKPQAQQVENSDVTNHGSLRRALPGLAMDDGKAPLTLPTSARQVDEHAPKEEVTGQLSPSRPSRIPSTGIRPTVMDVAEALSQSDGSKHANEPGDPQVFLKPSGAVAAPSPTEKRRPSYEKYTSIVLPPLKEESTPVSTPAATMSRKAAIESKAVGDENKSRPVSSIDGILSLAITRGPSIDARPCQKPSMDNVNFDSLLKYKSRHAHYESGSTTISVEVMAVVGTSVSALTTDRTIFYDNEVLVIIHRSKSQLSGLVATSVWSWEGKRATLGSREQRKLQEIAQRYSTTVISVQQNSEPTQLVLILGGVLAVRQGTRTRWTPENTAMHLIRSFGGVIFIDEKDLDMKNLCSGYSYCITLLDTVYVWYGRGSIPLERKAALEYGRSLTPASPPIEVTEDTSKDDEMFRLMLGDDEYANADYWKWRRSSSFIDPRIWRFDTDHFTHIDFISNEASFHESVYVIDCLWEFYIVVGSNARALRQNIELAVHIALELSRRVSPTRPYTPTVHTLILPSQIPRDLRLMFRDLDEISMLTGHSEQRRDTRAHEHIVISRRFETLWDQRALKDSSLLPLGGTAMEVGMLRYGIEIRGEFGETVEWRHWGCVTPSILNELATLPVGSIPGFKALSPTDQQKVKLAVGLRRINPEDIPKSAKVNPPAVTPVESDAKANERKRKAEQDPSASSQAIAASKLASKNLTLPTASQIAEDEAVEEVPEEVVDELYCTMNTNVVGLVGPGEQVMLIREPGNKFDRNAIQVKNIGRTQVGHLPRTVAQKLAPLMDQRLVTVEGIINDGNLTGRSAYALSITLRFYGASNARERLEPKLIWATPRQRGFSSQSTSTTSNYSRGSYSAGGTSTASTANYSQVYSSGMGSSTSGRPAGSAQNAAMRKQQEAIQKQQEALRKAAELRQMLNSLEKVDDESRRSSLLDTLCSNEDILNLPLHPNPPGIKNGNLKVDLLKHQAFNIQALQWCLDREYPVLPKTEADKPVQFWQLRKNGNKTFYYNIATKTPQETAPLLGRGALCADAMGLGKTLTMIALVLSTKDDNPRDFAKTTLIVLSNWEKQIYDHCIEGSLSTCVYYNATRSLSAEELMKYDVVITTYQTVAGEFAEAATDQPRKKKKTQRSLFDVSWKRVILDEGHTIRNPKTKMARAVCGLNAQRRWVLTGTPIDLGSALTFLQICRPLDNEEFFKRLLLRPLKDGDPAGVELLRALMSHVCIRRTKEVDMTIVPVTLTDEARKLMTFKSLYDQVEQTSKQRFETILESGTNSIVQSNVLGMLTRLRQLALHPGLVPSHYLQDLKAQGTTEESASLQVQLKPDDISRLRGLLARALEDFEECPICFGVLNEARITGCGHMYCLACITEVISRDQRCPMDRRPLGMGDLYEPPPPTDLTQPMIRTEEEMDTTGIRGGSSAKIDQLVHLLRLTPSGEKIPYVQFTGQMSAKRRQETLTRFSVPIAEDNRRNAGNSGGNKDDDDYNFNDDDDFISDEDEGFSSSQMTERKRELKGKGRLSAESASKGPNPTVMLLSLKAEGIESQAIDRVNRIGQKKPVHVYQLIAENTVESKVLEIQERKKLLVQQAFSGMKRTETQRQQREARLQDLVELFGLRQQRGQ